MENQVSFVMSETVAGERTEVRVGREGEEEEEGEERGGGSE